MTQFSPPIALEGTDLDREIRSWPRPSTLWTREMHSIAQERAIQLRQLGIPIWSITRRLGINRMELDSKLAGLELANPWAPAKVRVARIGPFTEGYSYYTESDSRWDGGRYKA